MTDLEELKRLLAESGGELRVLLAEMAHTDDGDVYGACLFGLAAVNALPDLIARVERAEKERRVTQDALRWSLASLRNLVAPGDSVGQTTIQIVEAALTGNTPNV